MVKVKKSSNNKKSTLPRGGLNVVLNKAGASSKNISKKRNEVLKSHQTNKTLKVVLNKVAIPKIFTSQKSHSSSQSQIQSTAVSDKSTGRRRELFVPIRPLDQIVLNPTAIANSPVRHTTPIPIPDTIVTSATTLTPDPVVASAPPMRRHAVVVSVTYRQGHNSSPEELEILCNNPFSCGNFEDLCKQCGAKFFSKEPKDRQMCCKNGKISIPNPSCPPELKPLYTENSERSKKFLSDIRAANSFFAMASFKTSSPKQPVGSQDRWCFSICGQIYHYVFGVQNSQDFMLRRYYFLDVAEVSNRRTDFLENRVCWETLQLLEKILKKHNRYIQLYKPMGEILRDEADRTSKRPVNDVTIAFSRMGVKRHYRLPEKRSEIAGVYFGVDPSFEIDLKLYPRNAHEGHREITEQRHEFKHVNQMCDPIVYPLLFPFGEQGYTIAMRHGNHRITMREFYRFRIQCRKSFSLLHNGGKLFQQYLIDAWTRVEANVVWWKQYHQRRFRFATYADIRRVIVQNPENAIRVGRPIVLPSELLDAPCQTQSIYLEVKTIAARHGKPDLFITFACNPRWPEIEHNLEHLQKFENRPDLVCRVFHTKLLEFFDDIMHKQIFGLVLNYHYVIEFKEYGLPCAHIVLTFTPDDKILTPEQVDKIISATIPDRERQPRLYELVTKYQVHRPCGSLNPNASCMNGVRCKMFYPKEYAERTTLGADGDERPVYKRPCDNRSIQYPSCTITNTRIIPYNAYALAKFQTQINFEVVDSLRTLKHLYRYAIKSQDSVTIFQSDEATNFQFKTDEVKNYLDCRYVSSMEAAWRLLKFKLHDRSHSIMVLPVHLPGEQYVVFEENKWEELESRLSSRTKLEAWFLLNTEYVDARQYSYREIPEYFVWNNREARWHHRQQISNVLGSLAEVTPRNGNMELLYLRLLLRHVRGATSFESLRTVNGVARETFKEACGALNLLCHTEEYNLCLSEAALIKNPRQMRCLFGLIISTLNDETIGQVPLLWYTHRDSLIKDYIQRGVSRRTALTSCVQEIDRILQRNRPELRCGTLDIVIEKGVGEGDETNDVRVAADVAEEQIEGANVRPVQYDFNSLNVEQKKIFLRIVQAVSRTTGKILHTHLYQNLVGRSGERLFFVDGAGGTGKTFLFNTLISYVSGVLGIPVVAVAWTGVAANLLVCGTTVHRSFRFPLNLSETSTVGWHVQSDQSQFFKRVGLIIWDEAPETHRYAIEAVDRYLREITNLRDITLGGKCCVFGGDFRQVVPTVPHAHPASIINASLKRSLLWTRLCVLKLTTNVRTIRQEENWDGLQVQHLEELGNRSFEEWLLALGEGRLPYVSFESLKSVPIDLVEIPHLFYSPNLQNLISFVYSDGFASEDISERSVLCLTNAMASNVNHGILELLPGISQTYVSVDEYKRESSELQIPQDVLNSVNVTGLPPHELKLKVGAIVMLLSNLDVENGECSGSRMRITGLGVHLIQCQLVSGVNKGRTVWLPRVRMISRDVMVPYDVIRTQFPVCLAYAMTIEKSQGETFQRVGVYLERSCFSHGQLYLAFSRVATPRNIRIYVEDGLKQGSFKHKGGKKFTRNVVFHALLDDRGVPSLQQNHRQIISRRDTANQTELEEMFENYSEIEMFDNIDVSQTLPVFEESIPDIEVAESEGPYQDPYFD